MQPILTLGSLYVTPYSLTILAGVLAGLLLVWRKKFARPLLPAVILGALVLGHVCWCLFCPPDLEAAEGIFFMMLRPWQGGYTLYGALLGGALSALIAGKTAGVKWLDALDALAPGACAVLFFARVGEVFTGEGIGRWAEMDWTHFFPLSICTYHDEFFEEWRYLVWSWEALVALIMLIVLLRRERKDLPRGHQTAVFLTILGTTQILLEQIRRDNYLRLIIFVRVNQLAAIITLIIVLVALLVRYKPGKAVVFWSLAVLVLAALADMASEFVFDKYEYAPFLFISMPPAAVAFAVLMWLRKKKQGILPAVLVCVATAALLIGYASKDWNNIEITPELDMIRFAILYATMAVDMVCIGLTIRLHLKEAEKA